MCERVGIHKDTAASTEKRRTNFQGGWLQCIGLWKTNKKEEENKVPAIKEMLSTLLFI